MKHVHVWCAHCYEYVPLVGGADYSVEKEPRVENKEKSKDQINSPHLKPIVRFDCCWIIKSTSIQTIVESVETYLGLYLQLELMWAIKGYICK